MVDGEWAEWGVGCLVEDYGVAGTLGGLPGEHDRNFVVSVSGRARYIMKVMHAGCRPALVEMQVNAFECLSKYERPLPVPGVRRSLGGEAWLTRTAPDGTDRLVWLSTFLSGKRYCDVQPKPLTLIEAVGETLAQVDHALADFEHPTLDRTFDWDLRRSLWVRPHLGLIDAGDRGHLDGVLTTFEHEVGPRLSMLPTSAIHNDANDYNLLVDVSNPNAPSLSGLIDFGDMLRAPFVCELAVAGAYVVLDHPRPFDALSALVRGYERVRTLSDVELELLFPLVLTRLTVSVVNAAIRKRARPDDPYVTVTERPAWTFLRTHGRTHPEWVVTALSMATGRSAAEDHAATLAEIRAAKGAYAAVVHGDLKAAPTLDLSVDGTNGPQDPFNVSMPETGPDEIILGRYREPRLVYTAPEFALGPHPTSDHRTVHLGVDVFAPAGTPVYAPCESVVLAVAYNGAVGDYGGVVVLAHQTPRGRSFYSLYGHLCKEVTARLRPGQTLAAGEAFAEFGAFEENGGWPPHLHFQLGLRPMSPATDWPGVANPDDLETAAVLFPNPAPLLNLDDEDVEARTPTSDVLADRRKGYFGANLETSYDEPLVAVRGWRHYIFDPMGRTYLDAYNNVPHVGHSHPRLTDVATRQLGLINTNTRYLHPARVAYAEALTRRLPPALSTCFFLNSASEANELALRLARAYTGQRDVIAVDAGYHGHTIAAIDISAYKFNGPGGDGPPDWVHVVPVADPYRGPHRGMSKDTAQAYAQEVADAIEAMQTSGRRVGAFICEPFPSVGGQIVPPDGYLAAAYDAVRAAGGLCIADEVQTGLGRLGEYFWGFEQQGAVPDIVVLGKPLGNGYPLAAVITTPDIASAFANGMEFFSTFGGSTLACAIGREVLQIVEDEALPANAARVGRHLLTGLCELGERHPIIGDVRGMGFFLGVDLVENRETRAPAPVQARYIVNRLRAHRILIGRDGPFENVLKIRPPLTFEMADADLLLTTLDGILQETPIQSSYRD